MIQLYPATVFHATPKTILRCRRIEGCWCFACLVARHGSWHKTSKLGPEQGESLWKLRESPDSSDNDHPRLDVKLEVSCTISSPNTQSHQIPYVVRLWSPMGNSSLKPFFPWGQKAQVKRWQEEGARSRRKDGWNTHIYIYIYVWYIKSWFLFIYIVIDTILYMLIQLYI